MHTYRRNNMNMYIHVLQYDAHVQMYMYMHVYMNAWIDLQPNDHAAIAIPHVLAELGV